MHSGILASEACKRLLLEGFSIFRVIVVKWLNNKRRSAGGDKMYIFSFKKERGKRLLMSGEGRERRNKPFVFPLQCICTTQLNSLSRNNFVPFPLSRKQNALKVSKPFRYLGWHHPHNPGQAHAAMGGREVRGFKRRGENGSWRTSGRRER